MSLHVGAQRLSFAAVISLEAARDACATCRVGERSVDSSRQTELVCLHNASPIARPHPRRERPVQQGAGRVDSTQMRRRRCATALR